MRGRPISGANVLRPAVRTTLSVCVFVVVFALVAPVSEERPTALAEKAGEAQRILDSLCRDLSIDQQVSLAVVIYHPFVFSVEPVDRTRREFQLSMELGFLLELSQPELRAALAHELGHVWIFTHHPFLQTERLANEVGQRAVARRDLERLYEKLWHYEGTEGVPIDQLLGSRH